MLAILHPCAVYIALEHILMLNSSMPLWPRNWTHFSRGRHQLTGWSSTQDVVIATLKRMSSYRLLSMSEEVHDVHNTQSNGHSSGERYNDDHQNGCLLNLLQHVVIVYLLRWHQEPCNQFLCLQSLKKFMPRVKMHVTLLLHHPNIAGSRALLLS